jgi:hypothetical protein
VNVEHVKQAEPFELEVGSQASAAFAPHNAEIVCAVPMKGKRLRITLP